MIANPIFCRIVNPISDPVTCPSALLSAGGAPEMAGNLRECVYLVMKSAATQMDATTARQYCQALFPWE